MMLERARQSCTYAQKKLITESRVHCKSLTIAKKLYPEFKVVQSQVKIANQRKAFHIRTAHHLCDIVQTIYAEDLNLKGLTAAISAKHCLDVECARKSILPGTLNAGWGMFLNILKWVSYKRGCYFEKVNAGGTSQLCPVCDVEFSKDLSVRVHECPECNYKTNRDVASAQVVLKRGIAALGHRVKKSGAGAAPAPLWSKVKKLSLP